MKFLIAALIFSSPLLAQADVTFEWNMCIRLNDFVSTQQERVFAAQQNFLGSAQICTVPAREKKCVEKLKKKYLRAQQNLADAQEDYVKTCGR